MDSKPPELVVKTPNGVIQTIRVEGVRLTIGRSRAADLWFPDDLNLSRQHLAFEKQREFWFLLDLGSKNGTLLNGVRVTAPAKLKPGDEVAAGRLCITFCAPKRGQETVTFVEHGAEEPGFASTTMTNLKDVLQENERNLRGVEPGSVVWARHISALVRAGRELAARRPLSELFQTIMDLAVEAVRADRGVLMTLEQSRLVVRAARGESFRISSAVCDRVLRQKHSLLILDAQRDETFREQASIVEHKVRNFMAVPLQTDEQVIGLIYVDKSSVLWDFTRDDLNLLTVLANVTAERIERERLVEVEQAERMHSKELEQAAEIQARLLPGDVPQVPGLDLAGYSAPCRTIGGDYYDFVGYPDASLALMLGDAAGKGMPSALLMSNVQARVRLLAEQPGSLSHLVARLSRAVHSSCPANRFVTFFICRLGPAARNLLYCNAGHNPALLIRGSGQIEKLDVGGMPLGVLPSLEYRESGCDFNPGDLLILYSDGVTEAVKAGSEEEFGPERLAAVVQQHRESTAREIIDAVIESICTWMAGAPYQDDITLVVARRLE